MPYIYRITRGQTIRKARVRAVPLAKAPVAEIAAKPPVNINATVNLSVGETLRKIAAAKPSYRDLQVEATALGIPAKQKAGALRKAIREAKRSGA